MEVGPKISGEAVIEKLKDDGDFNKLRLKIIRKLKDNEELRNNIVAIVKQSAALNRTGTENVKPWQISDAIYDEVGLLDHSKCHGLYFHYTKKDLLVVGSFLLLQVVRRMQFLVIFSCQFPSKLPVLLVHLLCSSGFIDSEPVVKASHLLMILEECVHGGMKSRTGKKEYDMSSYNLD